ncbi:MAG: biotin transporter BioY [Nanoarchaeota archaeon]|nr:biotin transporter BioY [Nanoarchaeota archaeon]
MQTTNKHKTMYELIFKQRNLLVDTFIVILSVAFLGLMANIRVPLWPVPITMQTFGIFLVAFFFGSRKGLIAMLAYISAGIIGIGVFTGYGSGIKHLIGPTGGYLIGFLGAAFIVGYMIEKGYGRTKKSIFWCMVIGNLTIYFLGLIGLWIYLGNIGLWKVLMAGLIPFLIGDVIKILGAVALFPYLWKCSEKLTR